MKKSPSGSASLLAAAALACAPSCRYEEVTPQDVEEPQAGNPASSEIYDRLNYMQTLIYDWQMGCEGVIQNSPHPHGEWGEDYEVWSFVEKTSPFESRECGCETHLGELTQHCWYGEKSPRGQVMRVSFNTKNWIVRTVHLGDAPSPREDFPLLIDVEAEQPPFMMTAEFTSDPDGDNCYLQTENMAEFVSHLVCEDIAIEARFSLRDVIDAGW